MRTLSPYQEPDKESYYVRGHLHLRCVDMEVKIGKLLVAIEEAENRMPWIDKSTNTPQKSIVCFNGSDFDYPPHTKSKVTWYDFALRGDTLSLEKGEIYAYEKHVTKLAEELARTRVCNLDVRCNIEITRYHYFEVREQS